MNFGRILLVTKNKKQNEYSSYIIYNVHIRVKYAFKYRIRWTLMLHVCDFDKIVCNLKHVNNQNVLNFYSQFNKY